MREKNLNDHPATAAAATEIKRFRLSVLDRMPQAEMAQILGVSVKTVSAWESGKHMPSPMACARLDAYCHWPYDTTARAFRNGTPLPDPAASSLPPVVKVAGRATSGVDPWAALAVAVSQLEAHAERQDARLAEQDAVLAALGEQLDALLQRRRSS